MAQSAVPGANVSGDVPDAARQRRDRPARRSAPGTDSLNVRLRGPTRWPASPEDISTEVDDFSRLSSPVSDDYWHRRNGFGERYSLVMEQLVQIPDEVLQSKWREIAPLIDVLASRIGESEPFPVVTGSAFTGDDRGAAPYSVTYVANACLSSSIDHLHALKALVWDARMLHTSAPATLARSAIENSVTGLWVISPASRDERINRSLRWYAQDARDQARATAHSRAADLGGNLERLGAIAEARGLEARSAVSNFTITSIFADLKAAGRDAAEFEWRLASGFAHGRSWASMGVLEREELPLGDDNNIVLRLTNSDQMALYFALKALHSIERLLQRREFLAGLRTYDASID